MAGASDRHLIVDGRVEAVGEEPLRFASHPEADIVLNGAGPDSGFTLRNAASEWMLEVEGDGGGIYVNGFPASSGVVVLSDGDHLEVGFHDVVLAGSGDPRPGAAVLDPASGELLIGRDAACDLTLDNPAVDNRHARITLGSNGLVVEDLNTRNGTRVNGQRIRRLALKPGDRLGIDSHRLVYDGRRLILHGASTPLRVEARSATVKAGEKVLLDGVSVNLEPGTLTAIIGESGAGKSTLMRALSGHHPPQEGAALLNGELITETRPEIAVVPQSDLVHAGLTVQETLVDSASLRLPPDSTKQELHGAALRTMEELQLTERRDLLVSRLSGGQKKRVSVGVEMVSRPGVLFLDEPTTGLDPGLEAATMGLLRELTDAGRTVALVTHATQSLSICDSLIVLGRGGVLCFQGSPEEALEFFSVETFAEIYTALADRGQEWAEAFEAISAPADSRPPLPEPAPRRVPRLRDFARDFRVLFRRQWRLLVRDRKNLAIIAAQAPALGVVTGILLKDDAFAPGAPPNKAVQILFVLVMISLWLGSIGSCRELVKEKSIVARERAAGVSAAPYLAAKLSFLLGLCALQVAVLLAVVFLFQPLDQPFSSWLQLAAVFAAVSLAAVTLGLAISALSGTESQAISIVPLALIPQLLFGGTLIPPSQMTSVMEAVSRLAASQWGLRGAGAAIDLQARFDAFPASPATEGLATGFFDISFGLAIGALAAIALVQLVMMAGRMMRSS